MREIAGWAGDCGICARRTRMRSEIREIEVCHEWWEITISRGGEYIYDMGTCVVLEMGLDGMATPLEIFSGGWSGGACWSGAASARAAAPAAARWAATF